MKKIDGHIVIQKSNQMRSIINLRKVKIKLSEKDIQKIDEMSKNRPHYPSWLMRTVIRRYVKELEEDSPKSSLERETNSK